MIFAFSNLCLSFIFSSFPSPSFSCLDNFISAVTLPHRVVRLLLSPLNQAFPLSVSFLFLPACSDVQADGAIRTITTHSRWNLDEVWICLPHCLLNIPSLILKRPG